MLLPASDFNDIDIGTTGSVQRVSLILQRLNLETKLNLVKITLKQSN